MSADVDWRKHPHLTKCAISAILIALNKKTDTQHTPKINLCHTKNKESNKSQSHII